MDCKLLNNVHEIAYFYGFKLIFLSIFTSFLLALVSGFPGGRQQPGESQTLLEKQNGRKVLSTLPLVWKLCNIHSFHQSAY